MDDFYDLDEVDRRQSLLWLGGASMSIVIPTSGCFFLLFRLLVGRGAMRLLGRAGRLGRTRAALTFGRGLSIGTRMSGTQLQRFPKTQIIGPKNKLVAESKSGKNGASVYVDGSYVFRSVQKPYGHRHYDFNGPVGRSYNRPNGEIVHKNEKGRITAIDKLRLAKKVIDHLDHQGNKIGETKYRVENNNAEIDADKATLDYVENLKKFQGLDCPDAKAAYDEMQHYQKMCQAGHEDYCADYSMKNSRYNLLRRQCIKKNSTRKPQQ